MVNYHVLTLFPDMVAEGLNTSILGRAAAKGLLSVEAINIRDYTKEKHGHVDDAPYGGGAGMVMQAAPICDAYDALCSRLGKRPRVLYMTPQGRVFNQKLAQELAREEDLVFLCGHYEGVDERALELIATDYLTIYWNIPSIPGRKATGAKRFRKCCCQGTTRISKPGGGNSLSAGLGSGVPIC